MAIRNTGAHDMGPDELEFRTNLNQMLIKYGKSDIEKEIHGFTLNVTGQKSLTGGVASINVDDKEIYVDKNFLAGKVTKDKNGNPKKPSWEMITAVIKHEILHAVRRHVFQSKEVIAKELHYSFPLTAEQNQNVVKIHNRMNVLFKAWNTSNTFNFAGDADLAQLYTDAEIREFRTLGGIIRTDYPEFEGMSFKELTAYLDKKGVDTIIRNATKHYGHINSDNTFTSEREEPSEFAAATSIKPSDISNISLPYEKHIKDIDLLFSHQKLSTKPIKYSEGHSDVMWLMDQAPETELNYEDRVASHNLSSSSSFNVDDVTYRYVYQLGLIYPIITVWALTEYNKKEMEFECGGLTFVRLPHFPYQLISHRPLEINKFSKRGVRDSQFHGSRAESILQSWLSSAKASERSSGGTEWNLD